MYGNGESERNLGRVLKSLKPDIRVGTKVGVPASERGNIAAAITASLEASLQRLQLDHVDLFQLHNHITREGRDRDLTPETVLGEVVPAFERLREQGKIRFYRHHGGRRYAGASPGRRCPRLRHRPGQLQSAQPERRRGGRPGYPAHDFGNLLAHAKSRGYGRHQHPGIGGGRIERHRGPAPARLARASSRSARAAATAPTSSAPGGSSRWSARAMPRA